MFNQALQAITAHLQQQLASQTPRCDQSPGTVYRSGAGQAPDQKNSRQDCHREHPAHHRHRAGTEGSAPVDGSLCHLQRHQHHATQRKRTGTDEAIVSLLPFNERNLRGLPPSDYLKISVGRRPIRSA